ncbi:MAG: hypothetical protein H7331_07930 [Bacteroidia bacterium]|nr:hypothetical protein [Bacteroidia bacterium]
MKKLTLSVLALATVASITSCKKGEEDPTLSLTSRKSRFAGEWKLDTQDMTSTTKGTDPQGTSVSVSKYTWTATTTKEENSYTGAGSSVTTTTTKEGTVTTNAYSIKKDGTWSSTKLFTLKSTSNNGNTVKETTYDIKETGTWNFLGKNDPNTKNKEQVALSTLTKNTIETELKTNTFGGQSFKETDVQTNAVSYAKGQASGVWTLLRLANKEMKIVTDINMNGTYSNSNTSGSMTTTSSVTSSTVSTGTMTLKQ